MTMTALELDDLLQRYQRPTALPTTRGTPFAPPGPEPEARSYTPPWYDRMSDWATALLHGPDANAQQRAGVHHILGPDNPLNLPAQFSEGYNTAKQGYDLGNAGMIGLGGLGMAMALPIGVAKPKGIRAYHGSPHDFDKFDLSKIGTGEGAQAYGHGLYFADNEGVAKSYRDKLTDGASFIRPDGSFWDPGALQHLNVRVTARRDGIDAAIAKAKELSTPPYTPATVLAGKDLVALEKIQAAGGVKPNPGKMYEVNIKAHPEDFLDWDKPLSQQSEKVKAALSDEAFKRYDVEGPTGPYGGSWTKDEAQKHGNEYPGNTAPWRIVEKNTESVSDIIHQLGQDVTKLKDKGIPGVKYLDQGSRAAGDGSRNYVVFDDALIEILRKYGLAGIMAGAGAAGAGGNAEAKP